jgi:hypothetical protein
MEIIIPAAGLSTRFPDMKPKYLLFDYKHDMMMINVLRPFKERGFKIHIGILKEHEESYNVTEQIQHEYGDCFIHILDKPTKGPADTVYQIIKMAGLDTSEIFIKDCDSFFDHEFSDGNYVCVSKISQHEILNKIYSKSFIISNNNGIITDIVEKEVVSDTFCVGGYKFSSARMFKKEFESITSEKEMFVSDVISRCINNNEVFTEKHVNNYVDVGTASQWFDYNDKPVIFCDIDGTIVHSQTRVGVNNYNAPPHPLKKNIERLLQLQKQGSQFIFTTARKNIYKESTTVLLDSLGFINYTLIMNLQNSRRILINDYNKANPFPRAEAINLERNADNLEDLL